MKRLIKLMSIALCMLLVLSAALASVFALSMNGVTLLSDTAESDTERADTTASLFKDESVYVIAGADGSVQKIIVSDWIQNNAHADTVTDIAKLDNIENVKSDETFTMNADGMRVWEAKGKDLYLEGEGTDPLPVDIRLSYFLDGKIAAPAELVGKSGDVTIRFDFTNNQYETVEIDGKKEKIYVPFMMLSGLILDSEKFTDVSVTNGKLISDGERTIVAGIAFPGLQKDLGLKQSDIQLPDYFEIKAHVEDFELGSTVTIATNGLLNQLDTAKFDSLNDIKKDLDQLQSAMSQLLDGSSQLYDGLATLLEKSSELTDGINQLYAGAEQLSDGLDTVSSGAGSLDDAAGQLKIGAIQLSDGVSGLKSGAADLNDGSVQVDAGANSLSAGLNALKKNNSSLTAGSDQTFASILATARQGLLDQGLDVPELTPSNYAKVLNGLIDNLAEDKVRAQAEAVAEQQVTAAVEANRDAVVAGVTEAVRANVQAEVEPAVRAQVMQSVLESLSYTVEQYNAAVAAGLVDGATQEQVSAAIDAQMNSDPVKASIAALVEQNMQSDDVKAAIAQNTEAQINALIEQNMQSGEVQQGISDAVAQAKAGVQSIKELKAQLDNYNTFNNGLKTYTSGVDSASDGANQLKSGASQLKSGTSQLKSGSSDLSDGADQLKYGTIQLSDGTGSLRSGTAELSDGSKDLLSGIITLRDGVPALADGVSQLKDGAMQLSDGLKQFNEEGVAKIVDLLGGDLSNIGTRLKAIVDVSKGYKSYTGLTGDMDGEVKFIYKTADLNKEK